METPLSPLFGLTRLGVPGVGQVVVKLLGLLQDPGPQEFLALARHQYCIPVLSAGDTAHWLLPRSLADLTTDVQPLSLHTSTSYEVASETSLQSRVGVVETPLSPLFGLTRLGVPGVGQVVVKLRSSP